MPKIVIRSNNQNEDVLHTVNADTLSDCHLSGLNLPKAAMYAVEIVGERRSKSAIIEVRARHADLSGAIFSNANLAGAVFCDQTMQLRYMKKQDLRNTVKKKSRYLFRGAFTLSL